MPIQAPPPLRPPAPAPVSLSEVAACAGVPHDGIPGAWAGLRVSGVTLDSRTVAPGDLYAALPGSVAHGADFAGQARQAGAVAVLTDPEGAERMADTERPPVFRAAADAGAGAAADAAADADADADARAGAAPWSPDLPVLCVRDPRAVLGEVAALVHGRPGSALLMLGVTGTNGKTTTAYLLDSALRALGHTTGLIGTVETRIGLERRPSVRTTPESTDVHALLALMRERGVDVCTMEVSSHALSLHRVDGVVYDVAGFTNLSQDHLDFHGTMEDYFAAKAELFTPSRSRRGVVCVDDPWGARLARDSVVPVVTVASSGTTAADWRLEPRGAQESRFTLAPAGGGRALRLRSALPGEFNRVNTALAALMLLACDVPAGDVESALAQEPHVPGRMERVDAGLPGQPMAVVDFAHTAEAVRSALDALRGATPGRLVVVLGAGGDRDRGKRPEMGRAAFTHADAVVVTDDNPRSEDPAAIRAQVLSGIPAAARPGGTDDGVVGVSVREIGNRAAAIRAAVQLTSGPEDTVLVMGKGHESGQEVAGVVTPFDDRVELRAALASLRPGARP